MSGLIHIGIAIMSEVYLKELHNVYFGLYFPRVLKIDFNSNVEEMPNWFHLVVWSQKINVLIALPFAIKT